MGQKCIREKNPYAYFFYKRKLFHNIVCLIPPSEAVVFLRLSANKQNSPPSDVVSGASPQLHIPHMH